MKKEQTFAETRLSRRQPWFRARPVIAGMALSLLAALCVPVAFAAEDDPENTKTVTVDEARPVEAETDEESAAPEAKPEDTAPETPAADAPEAAVTSEETDTEATEAEATDTAETDTETSEAEDEDDDTRGAATARWYRGFFETEFDSVFTSGDDDVDLSQYLRIDMDPPKFPRLHIRGSLWLHEDLSSDSGKPNTLRDINDASSADVQARLLYLYADIEDVLGDQSVLRIGRHRIQEGAAYNRIDGLYVRKRVNQFEWYAFIGARASVYRNTTDDLVLGGGASYRPGPHTRIALDGYYAEENRYGVSRPSRRLFSFRYRRPIADEINDSKIVLSVWHNFGVNTRGYARLGMLGSNVDELTLSLNGYIPRIDLLYDINYRQLFDSTGDTTADLSPFYQVLGQYRKHKTLYIGLHRPITKRITLSLEGEVRDAENDDFYAGNRDYQRAGAVLFVEDLYKKVDVSTSVEYWNVSGGEGTWTITGEISRAWKDVEWRGGVDYVRYKDRVVEYDRRAALLDAALVAFVPGIYPGFSYLTFNNATRVVDTRENVYSIYSDLEWDFKEDQTVYAKISFEEDDGPDSPYWRIRAGYRIRF